MTRLVLVRHGRPAINRAEPPHRWTLAAEATAQVRAIGPVGDHAATWFSSPEPKALATAALLRPGHVEPVADLREAERTAAWMADPEEFRAVVRRSFEHPDEPGMVGWEPLASCRDRVTAAVRKLLDASRTTVLVGHGTAWTLLVAELTGDAPDLDAWATMPMPAAAELDVAPDGRAALVRTWRG
jgi:broad specificity phosphatase PhoE